MAELMVSLITIDFVLLVNFNACVCRHRTCELICASKPKMSLVQHCIQIRQRELPCKQHFLFRRVCPISFILLWSHLLLSLSILKSMKCTNQTNEKSIIYYRTVQKAIAISKSLPSLPDIPSPKKWSTNEEFILVLISNGPKCIPARFFCFFKKNVVFLCEN